MCSRIEEEPIPVQIDLRVTPFGQVVFEMSKLALPTVEPQSSLVQEEMRFREPQETASLVYEIVYRGDMRNYIVPLVTA